MVIIEARFNGPPGSGNGGYTAGVVASALGAGHSGAVVTLRLPPPLETPMRLATDGAAGGRVYAGERLIAEAARTEIAGEPVPPVGYEEAVAAAAAYPGFADHPFPTCYVCGPQRAPGDGLRIFPGPVGAGRTASPWLVPDGVSAATVWAALDCPGGWAVISPDRTYVLGRMAARVAAVPPPGTRCVAVGEVVSTSGRKAQVRTAIYATGEPGPLAHADPQGRGLRSSQAAVLAHAEATWIALQ